MIFGLKAAGEEYYDTKREHNIKGRNETKLALWEEHLKDPNVAVDNIQVETEKACALIGLHMTAEENAWRSDSASSVSSSSSCEDNVGNDALFVIGLQGSGDTIALFLQDWEVAKVALSCHIALDMLCQEMHEVERRRVWFGWGRKWMACPSE